MRACISSVLIVFTAGPLQAQTTRQWIGPVGGDWLTATNWDPNGSPAVNDTLILGFGDQADASTFPFTLKDGGEIFFSDGADVLFDTLFLAEDSTATVTVASGSTVTTQQTRIASSFFGGGIANVLITGSGTGWTDLNLFDVGPVGGEGHVTVSDNASLSSPDMRLEQGSLTLTTGASAQAGQVLSTATFGPFALTVDDAEFEVTGGFQYASEGTGTLHVTNGGRLTTSGNVNRLAFNSGGNVTATIDSGGVWDLNGTGMLEVGGPIGSAQLVIGPGGAVNADAGVHISNTSGLTLQGGLLNTVGLQLDGSLSFSDGIINVNGGDFNYVGNLNIDGVNAQINLNTASSAFGSSITVGDAQSGLLTVNGSTLNTNDLIIGSQNGSNGHVSLNQGGGDIGFVTVGLQGRGVLDVSDSFITVLETMIGNGSGGAGGVLSVRNNAFYENSGQMTVGGSNTPGELRVESGASVSVEGGLFVQSKGVMILDDADLLARGEFSVTALESMGTIDFRSGNLTLVGGASQVAGGLVVPRDGNLLIDGGTFLNASLDSPVQGLAGSAIDASFGQISVGDPNSFTGFHTEGTLRVFADTELTIQSRGYAELGRSTQLFGQFSTPPIIHAPNGLALGIGDNLSGNGTVDAPFVMAAGSSVVAEGDLTIGDATAADGFFSDGRLHANTFVVTLLDGNDVVLGSLTTLGDAGQPGTVVAANGAVVEFGKNVTGYGTLDTPDDPFTPLINNGSIAGNSALEPITLSGYVKGVGAMDHVVITGTDAPGFSPATVYRGSIGYAGTLEIELGGTAPGDFDRIIHSGNATLGGTLDLSLINGYEPTTGDIFQIISASSLTGTFSQVLGLDLGGGLTFDLLYSPTDVTLTVISNTIIGDLNGDGFVGIADLNIVLGSWNQNVPPADPAADPSGDGFVGIADLNLVLGNWNAGVPPLSTPEPGVSGILGLCLLSGLQYRTSRA